MSYTPKYLGHVNIYARNWDEHPAPASLAAR